ncbi:hypothetical protein [Prosthecobacter fusiformis]|uniref:hypothetical protein n=1 Tax=Prosthecobacter fusiformis TaxID=48464 RepID=UPI00105DF1D6|nr:hypothetical protein [Prosthecobacter fusiformis]
MPSYPVVSRSPVKEPVDHAAVLGGLNPSRQGPGFAPAAAAPRQGKPLVGRRQAAGTGLSGGLAKRPYSSLWLWEGGEGKPSLKPVVLPGEKPSLN